MVAIIMGSDSDWKIMKGASDALKDFGVKFKVKVVSAHRTPEEMQNFGLEADKNGYKVIIAGAGGAAHLPGMVASYTTLPVIGVPVALKALKGLDSLLSIAQMPKGVPVATVAIDGAYNAGLLAVRILSTNNAKLTKQLASFRRKQKIKVKKSQKNLKF